MKNIFKILLCGLFFISTVHATPASDQSVEDLLIALDFDSQMSAVAAQTKSSMPTFLKGITDNILRNKKLTPEERKKIEVAIAKSNPNSYEIDLNKLKTIYIRILKKNLSEEDIKGMTAFYLSPEGKNINNKTTAFTQKTIPPLMKHVGESNHEIIKIFSDFEQEMKALQSSGM